MLVFNNTEVVRVSLLESNSSQLIFVCIIIVNYSRIPYNQQHVNDVKYSIANVYLAIFKCSVIKQICKIFTNFYLIYWSSFGFFWSAEIMVSEKSSILSNLTFRFSLQNLFRNWWKNSRHFKRGSNKSSFEIRLWIAFMLNLLLFPYWIKIKWHD